MENRPKTKEKKISSNLFNSNQFKFVQDENFVNMEEKEMSSRIPYTSIEKIGSRNN
jgi:sporulation protein YlmC with PRC-barrel domain